MGGLIATPGCDRPVGEVDLEITERLIRNGHICVIGEI